MKKKELIQQLSNKYGVPPDEVAKAVDHQSKYTRNVIREGKLEAVRWPYFGVFRVNKGRLKYLTKNKDKE